MTAGFGWFVDATPENDREFALQVAIPAQRRVKQTPQRESRCLVFNGRQRR